MDNKKYSKIFEEMIGMYLRNRIIFEYNSKKKKHVYFPYRHHHDLDTEKKLASFMRKYIYFYAYSEREVVEAYNNHFLNDLEIAANFALRQRLPNRTGPTNGLYSELLLDLLLTLFRRNVNKLATRAIYRQLSDNQEIKGYDGLHIVTSDQGKELWLGQAKMGNFEYCLGSIKSDLEQKINMLYMSKQLYFVADKERNTVDEALEFLKKINKVSMDAEMQNLSEKQRAKKLNDFFISEKIKLIFPSLLAYSSPATYEVKTDIVINIKRELSKLIDKLDDKFDSLLDIEYQILILFMPIRDLEIIRREMIRSNGEKT